MTKIIIMAMLMLLSLLSIAQAEAKNTYVEDIGHNRDCRGGLGTCSGAILTASKETTTTSVNKISKNQLEVTLDKAGFSAKEWEEMLIHKVFPIDDDSNITIVGELLRNLAIETKYNTIKPNNYNVTVIDNQAKFILELIEH